MATSKKESIKVVEVIRHEVHITFDNAFETKSNNEKLDQILKIVLRNTKKSNQMAQELDDLKAAVQRDTEVDQSAITLLEGLKTKLDDAIASGDPAQLQALSDQIGASTQSLADAVTANTPAEPGV